jgi:hypothetical protein
MRVRRKVLRNLGPRKETLWTVHIALWWLWSLIIITPFEIGVVSPSRIVSIGIWIIPWTLRSPSSLLISSYGVGRFPTSILNELRALM